MKSLSLGAGVILALAAGPALAVGLGPLRNDGVTAGERKGFYLTLINPYPRQEQFHLYSVEWASDAAVTRVRIPIARPVVGAKSQRRVLVIDTGLAPGETHRFRVCAERVRAAGEAMINARVCSKLTARRRG